VSARPPMRLIGGVMCSGAVPNVSIVGLGCGQHRTPWRCSPATCRWNKGSPATPHSNNTPTQRLRPETVGAGPRDPGHQSGRKWWRRLFTAPKGSTAGSGPVVGGDPTRRHFDGWLGKLIRLRDQTCRDPYCESPIRHLDHIIRRADDGPTTLENGRGTCERGELCSRNARLAHHPHRLRLPQRAAHHSHHHTHRTPLPPPRPRPTLSRSLTVVTSLSRDLCHTHGLLDRQ
jgi:hypothetical protein